jgi:L-alanine-DL-glutamate epimerase-like enolase superfamily enzyme
MEWAREGVVDVVQYDYLGYGFTRWLSAGSQLDAWGAKAAPHHYGGCFGNYASGHLAGAIRGFTFVEWDESTIHAIDGSAYTVRDGTVTLPDAPGFGLRLDAEAYAWAVADHGFVLEA